MISISYCQIGDLTITSAICHLQIGKFVVTPKHFANRQWSQLAEGWWTIWCENKRCSDSNPWPIWIWKQSSVLTTKAHHSVSRHHSAPLVIWRSNSMLTLTYSTSSRNAIRSGTCSQCRSNRRRVTWHSTQTAVCPTDDLGTQEVQPALIALLSRSVRYNTSDTISGCRPERLINRLMQTAVDIGFTASLNPRHILRYVQCSK